MTTWLRRLRGAVGMGVTWAVAWAVAGVLIGVTSVIVPCLPWGKFFDASTRRCQRSPSPASSLVRSSSFVLGVVGDGTASRSCRCRSSPRGRRSAACY